MAGKVAIITGAAQGLGRSFAESLAKRGAKVCVADVNVSQGKETAETLCKKYGTNSAFFQQCDVTDEKQFESCFQETIKAHNKVDILCNNAGIMHEGRWDQMVDINLKAVIRGIHLGIKYMGADRGGSGGVIVNIASYAGIHPMVFGPVYTATKHGVVGLTKAWANEPGYATHKVKIAALCPAIADTPLAQSIQPEQVTNLKLAQKVFDMLGVLSCEKVSEAFLQLLDGDDCNGKILTISSHTDIQEHQYNVGKSMVSNL